MSVRNKLVSDGIYTFAFRIANMALSALLGILTARALGPAGRGVYALPMVDAALVTAAFTGLTSSMSFFMLRRNSGRSILRPALTTAFIFVAVGSVATLIIAVLAHAPWVAIPAMLSLPAPAILCLLYGYSIGINRVRMNTSYALANTAVLFGLMLLAFLIAGREPLAAIVAWVVAGNLFGAGVLVWMWRHSRSLETKEPVTVREFFSYAIKTGTVSLVSLLNYRADVYLVAVLTNPAMLGMYTLAVSAAETLLTTTTVTALVSSPLIGTLEPKAAAELTARCIRHNVFVAAIACGILALLAPFAVHLLYGQAFVPMVPALRVLLIGVFALSLGSPMSTYFTIRLGRAEVALTLAGVSAAICIALSFVLIPRLGLVGAALASTIAYAIGQTGAIVYFALVSGISPANMLLPRVSDVLTYVDIIAGYAKRLRRA